MSDVNQDAPLGWPPAVEVVAADGRSPLVLLCEHASNHIPAEYNGLGLPPPQLRRHIAWDIGAAGVTRALSGILNATAFLGNYSRLLIDLNRPLHAPSSLVTRSEDTDIPGNFAVTEDERRRRIEHIFNPYHQCIQAHLSARAAAGRYSIVVAIHSFTPTYHGVARPWHAGVLFDQGVCFGMATLERLRAYNPTLNVAANVPYAIQPGDDYAFLNYGDKRGNPSILLEIRQDLLARPEEQQDWARMLAATLAIDVALA